MNWAKKNKTAIIVAGPTAVGKTAVAIAVAKQLKTEIISADSRQCFKELNIGVARPSADELQQVNHHFIATHSIMDIISAASFEQYALRKINELFLQHDSVVMTGGTGLYIKAFCEGLDEMPAADPAIRKKISGRYKENGLPWLQQQLQKKDLLFSKEGEMQNPQRMMRALEVMESTGQSILTFYKKEKTIRDFKIIKIGLQLPKEELVLRINNRVDKMIAAGLVEEVEQLTAFKNQNALQTVGYSEIFNYLDKKMSLPEAIERIKINTRQYAKRQMTWFKKDTEMNWFFPAQASEVIAFINSQ